MRIVHMVLLGVAAAATLILGLPLAAAKEPEPEPPSIQMSLPMSKEWAHGELTPRNHLFLAYGLSDKEAKLLDRVVVCESGWKPAIENASSTASGLAQFLDSTWRSTRQRMGKPDPDLLLKHEPYEHLDTFVWLYRADGIRHWYASKGCWGT